MYLYHACQRTKESNSLLPHHYTWICILGIHNITEDIICCPFLSRLPFARNRSCWWSGVARRSIQSRPMILGAEEKTDAGDASLYRQPFTELCRVSSKTRWSWVGSTAHCRAALHRPDVNSAADPDDPLHWPKPDQLNETFEFKEAAQIDPEPEQLNQIFEFEEATQINPDLEQLNEIFEVEEAAHIDPEP